MPAPIITKAVAKPKRKIPDYLVYEVMDSKPIYYRGYQSVMSKTKTLEQIMGCSSLQAELISYLLSVIYQFVDRSKYRVYTNNNLSNGIMDIRSTLPTTLPKRALSLRTK